MEGFIADSTYNIISTTLDEKSFFTKTNQIPLRIFNFAKCVLHILYYTIQNSTTEMKQTVE